MRKAIGKIIKVGKNGRIHIPIKLMRDVKLFPKTEFEIYKEEDYFIIEKYHRKCLLCGSKINLIEYKGKVICDECLTGLEKAFNKECY